jgi:hypothetical protein
MPSASAVLDALHEPDEPVVAVAPGGREADSAVAGHRGGHAVPARRREVRVPGGLAVVVGVYVDEARRHQQPVGVDLPPAGGVDPADLHHHAVVDRDVGSPARLPAAVDHRACSHHQIVHASPRSQRVRDPERCGS